MSNFHQFLKSHPDIGSNTDKNTNDTSQQLNFQFLNSSFYQLLLLKIQLSKQLIINQFLLSSYGNSFMNPKADKTSNNFSKAKSAQTKALKNEKINYLSPEKNGHKKKKAARNFQGDQYVPEQIKRQNNGEQNPSLRVPAAIGHEILRFIKKQKGIVKRILEPLGVQYKKFFMVAKYYRQKVNLGFQVKSIWHEENNKYAKAFRIISQFYLRKVKISITFNSSVENYHKHLKWIKKVRLILQNIQSV